MTRISGALALALALAAAPVGCHHDDPAPRPGEEPAKDRVAQHAPEHAPGAPRSDPGTRGLEIVTFMSGPLKLTGDLWLPKGAGPFRAIVDNHGSEREPQVGGVMGRFFNAHGFAFFKPVRRGHGQSQGTYEGDAVKRAPAGDRNKIVVDELTAQVDDVLAGVEYLRSRGEVRKDGFALMGCSYGGIVTVLASERSTAFKVAVDFAGASQSWAGNELLRERMTRAVDRATVPIFFLQAENDYDTTPSKALAAEMERVGKPHQLKIYPAHGTTREEGHGGFCSGAEDAWGADVIAWIDRYLPR